MAKIILTPHAGRAVVKTVRGLVFGAAVLLSAVSWASDESVTSGTYNKLTDIQELLGEEKTEEAYEELLELREDVDADTIDEAMVLQMLGYTEMSRENYSEAIDYMKASLALDKLPEQMKYELGYMVAQLLASQEKFDEAIGFAEEWFETLEEPKPEQLMFMANLLAQTERYARALPYAERAVEQSEKPRESWYQLLISSSFILEEYEKTAQYLKATVSRWPDEPRYWEQLASIYMMLEEQDQALVTLQLAWRNDVLTKENSIRSLVQLTISRGIPERGGRFLQAALEQELVPREEKFLELLVNAWSAGREYDRAITALEELATVTETGDPYLRVANIHVERARWSEAEEAAKRAQQLGVEEPGKAWLTLGIALIEQEQFSEGVEAFRKARAFDYAERQAKGWLNYAEDLRRQSNWKARNSG